MKIITPIRFLVGIGVGVGVALSLLIAVELFSSVVHPVPEGSGSTKEEIIEHVARYPHWVLALVVPAWGITAVASTWTAKRIGGQWAALVIGILLMAAVLCNVSMLPYPAWFKGASVAAIATVVVYAAAQHIRSRTNVISVAGPTSYP